MLLLTLSCRCAGGRKLGLQHLTVLCKRASQKDFMQERYISVDVETAGPIPGKFSLLTIGACVTDDFDIRFQCSLKPLNGNFIKEALDVTQLSLEALKKDGQMPQEAMQSFADWVEKICTDKYTPVFVGLNAPFDWSFVNYYFHEFIGKNPFGISALDIKSLYMGKTNCSWNETTSKKMADKLKPILGGTHDALEDAIYQAELFNLIHSEAEGKGRK